MANKQVIVVGGGLSGILATLSLSRQKNVKTTLVERSSSLGGLFSSAWNYEDYHFDFGSRFIVGTGYPEIDSVLFNLLGDNGYWVTTKSLAEHSYQNGTVCDYSNCLDARLLDDSRDKMWQRWYPGKTRQFLRASIYVHIANRPMA